MDSASAVYEGWVSHRRYRPRAHSFRYRIGLLYVDLAELPEVLDAHPLWSARRFAPAWLRRADYLRPTSQTLLAAVRRVIKEQAGVTCDGPVRLLTHPRYWGTCFNPVSFYYVFAADGQTVQWIIADVSNTPWLERHAYVLGPLGDVDEHGAWRPITRKTFHVSPFMAMDMEYRWLLRPPADTLVVNIENHTAEGRLFDATLSLRRHPVTKQNLGRLLWRYPVQTVSVVARIYWQALRLWRKRIPYVPHPDREERGRS
jgi:DUF1365 family protein